MGKSIYEKPVHILMRKLADNFGLHNGKGTDNKKIVAWFQENYPKIKKTTVRAHIRQMTTNVNRVSHNPKPGKHDLFFKDKGKLILYDPEKHPTPIYKYERNDIEEFKYQQEIEKSKPVKIESKPQAKPESTVGTINQWKRSLGIAKAQIIEKNYSCEVDKNHKTFISNTTGENYVEVHHLIPMNFQKQFEYSLDVPGNLVILCPNCHRLFHHATSKEKSKIITSFYDQRKEVLKEFGIEISVEKLKRMYK